MAAISFERNPNAFFSLWVGQFGSRQAFEDYRALRPADQPDDEPSCGFLADIGLHVDWHDAMEGVFAPDLWREGPAAFTGLSGGRDFGPGAARVARELGLEPFDAALLVWSYPHQNEAEPGEESGPLRFVGTFCYHREPE